MANYIPRRQNVSSQPRGEPLCPRCGSTNLVYKNVFDYYKCNECGITFITPVFNYNSGGLDTARDIASKIFGEGRSAAPPRQTAIEMPVEEPFEEEIPEPVPRRRPARTAEARRRQKGAGMQAWLAFALIICVIIIACLVAWIIFGDQLGDILMGTTGVIL